MSGWNSNDAKDFLDVIKTVANKTFDSKNNILKTALAVVIDASDSINPTIRLLNSPEDGSQDFDVLNMSGESLVNGDSVWLHYWDGYTNAYIAVKNGEFTARPGSAISSNLLINGGFDIWQRGASFSSPFSGTYTADRWSIVYNGTGATRVISRQAFVAGQTDVPNNPTYFLRCNQSVGGGGGTYNVIQQRVENVLLLSGKTVTLSFYAMATSPINIFTYASQNFGSGGSTDTGVLGDTVEIGSSWSKYTQTFVIPSVFGKTIGVNNFTYFGFFMPNNATFTFDIANVQLNYGSVALPFVPRTIAEETAAAFRYAIRLSGLLGKAVDASANYLDFVAALPSTMRVTPTLSGLSFTVYNSSGILSGFTISIVGIYNNLIRLRASKNSHGVTDAILAVSTEGVLDAEL